MFLIYFSGHRHACISNRQTSTYKHVFAMIQNNNPHILIKRVTARFSGVRPGLSKGRYGHVSTRLDNPTFDRRITFCEILSHPYPYTSTYSLAHRKMEREGMSNGLLSEVTLDQPAHMTIYTTLCGNHG
ncbi:hypothetical protein YC2023_037035 [Brassica napus]